MSAPAQAQAPGAFPPAPVEAPVPAPALLRPVTVPMSPNETHPEIKLIASKAALALTTYNADEGPPTIAARLVPLLGEKIAAASAGTLYYDGCWSRGRIVYAQFGGLLSDSASVMVVTEQSIGAADGLRKEIRTLDVRLVKRNGVWGIDHIASTGGSPVAAAGDLPLEAVAVLRDPRIELSDSARWDIISGNASPALLRLMARLAEQTPFGVVTLSSGHPWEIFGTPRQSDHTRGLAMDIYRIGDSLVIDQRSEDSRTHALVEWLYAQPEVMRIGSPWALDGHGGRSFTDALHQDHVHVAVVAP